MKHIPPDDPPKTGADWLAWTLHLLFGLFVGAGIGFYLGLKWSPAKLAHWEDLVALASGISLIFGAAASHWGESLWTYVSHLDRPPYPRSRVSAAVSIAIAMAGLALAGVGIASIALHRLPSRINIVPIDAIPLVLAAGFLALCVHAIKTDTMFGTGSYVHRHESPLFFWLLFTIELAAALWLILLALG